MSAIAASERLISGGRLVSAWSVYADSGVVEALARTGFDAVTLDMQHGAHDFASVNAGIAAIVAAEKPAAVRLPLAAWGTASRVLDAGATIAIAPMVNSAADARAFVAATKYPPVGERSWGPQRAMALTGLDRAAYVANANRFCVTLAMIETAAALDAIDEILAVDGLDGVFVGPSDLSLALSGGTRIDPAGPEVDRAVVFVQERAAACGKIPGIFTVSAAMACRARELDYRFIAVGLDSGYLAAGAATMLAGIGTAP